MGGGNGGGAGYGEMGGDADGSRGGWRLAMGRRLAMAETKIRREKKDMDKIIHKGK